MDLAGFLAARLDEDEAATAPDLDPRWDWVDVSTVEEGYGTTFVRGACRHLELEPVEDLDGELVAKLCLTCDKAFTLV